MKTVSTALKNHLAGEVTTLAVLWKVVRMDGATFTFTDHTEDLLYEGNTYKAASGFFRSAVSNSSAPESSDMEVSGILDDEGIVEQDVVSGKFNYAEVWLRVVNYDDLAMGHLPLRYGRFGEVQLSQTGKFVIELRGLIDQLSNAIGDTYSPDCRTDLFSEKCKLTASALPRIAGKVYAAGDRVTVPTLGAMSAYALPFPNLNFQGLQYMDSTVWAVSNMFANIPPGTAVQNLSPSDWVSSVNQTVAVNAYTADGTLTPEFEANMRIASFGPDLQLRVRMVFLDNTQTEISTVTTMYATLEKVQTRALRAAAPLGTWYIEYWIETRKKPNSLAEFGFNQETRYFNPGLFLVGPNVNLLADTAFLTFTIGTATVTGWDGAYLSARQTHRGFAGPRGKMFVINTSGGGRVYSSGPVSLVGGPADDADIDTGDYVVDLSWWQANLDLTGKADMRPVFFGPTLPVNGVADTFVLEEVFPVGDWKNRKKTVAVPIGARSVSIEMNLEHSRDDVLGGVQAAIGDISTSLRSKFDLGFNFTAYGGVEYVAQNAGAALSTEAYDWDRTLGATVSDGAITWLASVPRFSNLTTIASVTSRGIFTLGADVSRPDNYFQWGLLVFMSGRNVGFSADIAKFTSATQRIELAMPLPFVPEIGDEVWVQVGCDKRIETCHAKFGNAVNFRGEPWLPGTDQYFKVGSPV